MRNWENEKVQGWERLKQNQKKAGRDRKDSCGFNYYRIEEKEAKMVEDFSFNYLNCLFF